MHRVSLHRVKQCENVLVKECKKWCKNMTVKFSLALKSYLLCISARSFYCSWIFGNCFQLVSIFLPDKLTALAYNAFLYFAHHCSISMICIPRFSLKIGLQMQDFKTVSAWLFYGGNVGSFYLLNLHYGIVLTVPKLILDGDTRIYSSVVYSVDLRAKRRRLNFELHIYFLKETCVQYTLSVCASVYTEESKITWEKLFCLNACPPWIC